MPKKRKVESLDSSSTIDSIGAEGKYIRSDEDLVPVSWFLDVVASVALCVDRNEVPLLCGPVGCGKTAVIDYLIKMRSVRAFRMQISEQTDAKALLGAYCCSSTPGVFIWRPGPLTHCMTSGKWLILEDVDRGTADLPILLSPLFRRLRDSASRLLHPNTGEPINRHPEFRILLTRRALSSAGYCDQIGEPEVYLNNCSVIYMDPMPVEVIMKVRIKDVFKLCKCALHLITISICRSFMYAVHLWFLYQSVCCLNFLY